ncbi:cytochrome c oxidase assembly protein [Vibrio cortegadensis]|uniref:cytochrome c oxidase assembly protein n=1 Tax=Vibrio cortegadensis TaxID=1328770 RepID=UPI00352C6327
MMEKKSDISNLKQSNRKLVVILCASVIGMFGFGFALVPLYDVMCDVLGINGKTNTVSAIQPQGMQPDVSRTIRVELMAHISPDMPWTFVPQSRVIDVHPGQVIQTAYLASNKSHSPLIGQAVPSVSPGLGASYFNKIECFCFNQQPLEANAQAEMPLIFYIEPDIPDSIHTLTLSYTLFNITTKENSDLESNNVDANKESTDTRDASELAKLSLPAQIELSNIGSRAAQGVSP